MPFLKPPEISATISRKVQEFGFHPILHTRYNGIDSDHSAVASITVRLTFLIVDITLLIHLRAPLS